MTEVPIKLLLVDDDNDFRQSCLKYMQRKGFEVQGASGGAEAMSLLQQESFDVAVFDMDMPAMSGLELMQRVSESEMDLEVIFLTGHGSIETAVAAMKLGACDYLTKPCSLGDLQHHCLLAKERNRLRKENRQLKAMVHLAKPKKTLIGDSPAMQAVIRMIEKVAPTRKPVLIEGESGTGKEVVARSIQERSELADKPFVTINCAALPESLVESELFGHIKGSFTGATTDKQGLFEIADGGTLFIDEVGELPLSLQPKLLRVLEDGSFRRVGCHRERKVAVRLIAATNRDLAQAVKQGTFREDLYYRINVMSLVLPPLRERMGDVKLLVENFMPKGWSIDDDVMEVILKYNWPGNVRQLINVIERATVLADHEEITLDDLPIEIAHSGSKHFTTASPHRPTIDRDAHCSLNENMLGSPQFKLDEVARVHVMEVLAKEKGNKASAARRLGIHRRKLYRLLDRFSGLARDADEEDSDVESVI